MGIDLRRFPRWRHLARVRYSSPTIRGEGQLANLSQDGAFVRADALPLAGERVHVVLQDGPPGEFEGEVCWTGPRSEDGEMGFGMRLVSCSPGYADRIRTVAGSGELEPAQPPERPAPRVAVAIPVALESGTLCDEGQMRDISISGARIEGTHISLGVGSPVMITFSMSLKGRAFAVPSRVVRRTDGGYAIRFETVESGLREAIEGAVSRDEPEPSPIQAEAAVHLGAERDGAAMAAAQSWGVLARLAESAQDPVVSVDDQQRILLINSAAERLFGVAARTVLGKRLGEVLDRSGQAFPVDASISCVESRGRSVFTVLVRDVSERLRNEQALRESEKRFRVMADTIPDILFNARSDGWTDYTNARFRDYTGMASEAAEGHGWIAAVHPDDVERCLAAWRSSVASGAAYEIKYRLRSREGSYRWFVGRARPIRDESGQVERWFGVCSDIHELVLAQELLREAASVTSAGK